MEDTKKTIDESLNEAGEQTKNADTGGTTTDDIKKTLDESIKEVGEQIKNAGSAISKAMSKALIKFNMPIQPKGKDAGEVEDALDDINKMLYKRIKVAAKNGMIDKPIVEQILKEGFYISFAFVDKYTIVDIGFGGCTYQGLASKHPDDKINIKEGIGRALSRAFDKMCVRNRFKNQKDLQIITGKDLSEPITWAELEALIETD